MPFDKDSMLSFLCVSHQSMCVCVCFFPINIHIPCCIGWLADLHSFSLFKHHWKGFLCKICWNLFSCSGRPFCRFTLRFKTERKHYVLVFFVYYLLFVLWLNHTSTSFASNYNYYRFFFARIIHSQNVFIAFFPFFVTDIENCLVLSIIFFFLHPSVPLCMCVCVILFLLFLFVFLK